MVAVECFGGFPIKNVRVYLMKKRVVLSVLLAAALLLSGCSLVVKDQAVDNARTVVSVNGETVNKETFMQDYNSALQYQEMLAQFYANYGMTAPAVSEDEILQQTVDSAVQRLVLRQKARELRLDELSAEENAKVDEDAQSAYGAQLESVKSQYFSGTQLEGDALAAALAEKAAELGINLDAIRADTLESAVLAKVRAESVKDVTVTAEEIQAEHSARVEKDKTAFEADKTAYGTARNGGTAVYYAPAGYRMVKQVLVKFLADDQAALDKANAAVTPLTSAVTQAKAALAENETALAKEGLAADELQKLTDKKAELQKALDDAVAAESAAQSEADAALEKAYANIEAKAQDVYAKATSGAAFDDLVKEYNEDGGQPAEGYAICEGFTSFDEAFVAPAMALTEAGSVAQPSKGIYGFYIVQYAADVAEGPAPLDTVSETIKADLLAARQEETYNAAVQSWTAAAQVETFPNVAKD